MAKEKVKDEFTAYAEEVAQKEKEKQERKASGGGTFEYTPIKWSGLEKGKMKIVRPLGGVPESGKDKFTARTVRIAKVIDDRQKSIKVRFPTNDPEFILARIIDKVGEIDWVKGEDGKNAKVFVNEKKHPEIFNMVMFNGLNPSDPKRKFGVEGKGWWGKEMLLINAIDRDPTMYQWSKENKHSVLLSKNVNIVKGDDGKILEFADDGIPSYGFSELLAYNLFKTYGNWNNYDVGLERTGQTNPSMRVINACKHLEEVPEELQDFVVEGPITEEEKSWEMYDLDLLFGPTSYTKLYNKLRLSIAKIDLALGTHYESELKSLADKEAEERDAARAANAPEENGVKNEVEVTEKIEEKIEERVPAKSVESSPSGVEALPGYNVLTDEEKEEILSVSAPTDGSKTYSITFKTDAKLFRCPDCKTPAPSSFHACPGCGFVF